MALNSHAMLVWSHSNTSTSVKNHACKYHKLSHATFTNLYQEAEQCEGEFTLKSMKWKAKYLGN